MNIRSPSHAIALPLVATFLLYAALTAAAGLLTRLNHGIALIWLANGPLLAMLCKTPPRQWPAYLIAAWLGMVAVVVAISGWHSVVMPYALVDVGEAAIAAALLRRWRVNDVLFRSIDTVPLFVAACLASVAVCALPGAAVAIVAYRGSVFQPVFFDWIVGHGLGLLLVTPLALVARRDEGVWIELARPRHAAIAAGAAVLVAVVTFATFRQNTLPLLFMPFLPVVIATFALQRAGAAASVVIVATIGGVMTLHGHGPVMLMDGNAAERLQFFQFYLAALFVTALPIAALLKQREALMGTLAENEARYRLLADHATDIMMTLNPDGSVRFVSPSVREVALYDPAALIGRSMIEVIHAEDRDRVRAHYRAGLAAPERTVVTEFRALKADGVAIWFEASSRVVADGAGVPTAIVCILRDLDGRKRREAELERAASTDPLTGVLNRNAFRGRVEMRLRGEDQPGTLALIDLDHFKTVNDAYGHATGDAALLALADLLRANLRPDDAVGRIGGEEFAILFAGHGATAAVAICDRLRETLAATDIPTADGCFSITMSAGVMPLRRDMTIDALFGRADEALYRAKALGRNRTERAVG